MSLSRLSLLLLLLPLAACDQIAALDGSKAREADGVAVGSACRQAGRAIEDCFTMNPDAPKASVFAGWKEMNDYMVQNKLETVKPEIPRPEKEAKEAGKKVGASAAAEHGAGAPVKIPVAVPEVVPVAAAAPAASPAPVAPFAPAVADAQATPFAPAAIPSIVTPVRPAVAAAAVPNTSTPGRPPVTPGSPTLVIPGAPPVTSAASGTPPAPTPASPRH